MAALAILLGLGGCDDDLATGLFGRACLEGRCISGFECVNEICVPAGSGHTRTPDSGPLRDASGGMPDARAASSGDAARPDAGVIKTPPSAAAGTEAMTQPTAGNGSMVDGDRPGLDGGGLAGSSASDPPGAVTGPTAGAGSGGGSAPAPCGELTQCGGVCTDTLRDARNCGACGRQCLAVQHCIDGACRLECGESGPVAASTCPPICDACEAGTCVIRCGSEQACKEDKLHCPAGMACLLECSAKQACEGVELTCAPGQLCSLRCAGEQACKKAKLECKGAACEMVCAGDGCEDAELRCGAGACRATCAGGDGPQIRDCMRSCNRSCDC